MTFEYKILDHGTNGKDTTLYGIFLEQEVGIFLE